MRTWFTICTVQKRGSQGALGKETSLCDPQRMKRREEPEVIQVCRLGDRFNDTVVSEGKRRIRRGSVLMCVYV